MLVKMLHHQDPQMLADMWMSLQPTSSGRQMADAAAEAAGTAVDKVADAESDQRERSEGASTSGSPHAVVEISDAVLQQRTYFVPTMVSASCRLCHQMTMCICHDLPDLLISPLRHTSLSHSIAWLMQWRLLSLLTSRRQTCSVLSADVQLCWDAVQLSRRDALMLAAVACPCFEYAAHVCAALFCGEC